ncbi:perilipin-1-like isoform X2 [Chiloscyllium punctatum]|uniref:perilipin-1-like isoform X2 n=1 Tax=Chiloscyllium punctatum TaxID=137246 RepID=UPI003B640D63
MTANRSTSRAAQPNIIWRVRMLPLVNSTSQVLLNTYSDVKRTNWLTSTLCNAVETSARMATGLAARRAKPFLDLFESQLATVNTFASKRLDKLEEEFPILQLSIDEVTFHLRESWTLTLDNAQERLNEEAERLRARSGALVEETRMVMAGQASAFLTTRVGRLMVASGDSWVRLMEETLDRYLPDYEDNCVGDAGVHGFERDIPGERSLLPRVQRLTHKLNSRLSQRMLLYSRRTEEGTLTDILLLVQLFDRLQDSWAVAMLDGSLSAGCSDSPSW